MLFRWVCHLHLIAHGSPLDETAEIRSPELSAVFWPASYDQVQTAVGFSHEPRRIGVELLQVRNGYNINRATASGVFVHGTEGAMRDEFTRVFSGLRGELGVELRTRVEQMQDEMEEDMTRGDSRLAMEKLLAL